MGVRKRDARGAADRVTAAAASATNTSTSSTSGAASPVPCAAAAGGLSVQKMSPTPASVSTDSTPLLAHPTPQSPQQPKPKREPQQSASGEPTDTNAPRASASTAEDGRTEKPPQSGVFAARVCGQPVEVVVEHVDAVANEMKPHVLPVAASREARALHELLLLSQPPPLEANAVLTVQVEQKQKPSRESIRSLTRRVAALRVRGPQALHEIDEAGDLLDEFVTLYVSTAQNEKPVDLLSSSGVAFAAPMDSTSADAVAEPRAPPQHTDTTTKTTSRGPTAAPDSQLTRSRLLLLPDAMRAAVEQLRADLRGLRDERKRQAAREQQVLTRVTALDKSLQNCARGATRTPAEASESRRTRPAGSAASPIRSEAESECASTTTKNKKKRKTPARPRDVRASRTPRPPAKRARRAREDASSSPSPTRTRRPTDQSFRPATSDGCASASASESESEQLTRRGAPRKRTRGRATFTWTELRTIERLLRRPRAQFPAAPSASRAHFNRVVARAAIAELCAESADYVNLHTEYTFACRVQREYERLRAHNQIDPFSVDKPPHVDARTARTHCRKAGGEQPADGDAGTDGDADADADDEMDCGGERVDESVQRPANDK